MSVFSKPTQVPYWAETGTRTEPLESKKQSGWVFNDIPPSYYENWRAGTVGDWFQWINERFYDGSTIDELKLGIDTLIDGDLSINDNDFVLRTTGVVSQIFWDLSADTRLQYHRDLEELRLIINGLHRQTVSDGYLRQHNGYIWSDKWVRMGPVICIDDANMRSGWEIPSSIGSIYASINVDGSRYILNWNSYSVGNDFYFTKSGDRAFGEYWNNGILGNDDIFSWRISDAVGVQDALITWDKLLSIKLGGSLYVKGGVMLGFNGPVYDYEIKIKDGYFGLTFINPEPRLSFDNGDYIEYVRGSNRYNFSIGTIVESIIGSDGIRVRDGIYVGSVDYAPESRRIYAESHISTQESFITYARSIWFASIEDRIEYKSTDLQYNFLIDGTAEFKFSAISGLKIQDENFRLYLDGTYPMVIFDQVAGQKSTFEYSRGSGIFSWSAAATYMMTLSSSYLYHLTGDIWADGNFVTFGNYVRFGGPTPFYLRLNGSTFEMSLGNVEWTFGQTYMDCKGNYITNANYLAVNDSIRLGDQYFRLSYSPPLMITYYDWANFDYHVFNRSTKLHVWAFGGVSKMQMGATNLTHLGGYIEAATDLVTNSGRVRFGGSTSDDYISFDFFYNALKAYSSGNSFFNASPGKISVNRLPGDYAPNQYYLAKIEGLTGSSESGAISINMRNNAPTTILAGSAVVIQTSSSPVGILRGSNGSKDILGVTIEDIPPSAYGPVAIAGVVPAIAKASATMDAGEFAIAENNGEVGASFLAPGGIGFGLILENGTGDGVRKFMILLNQRSAG